MTFLIIPVMWISLCCFNLHVHTLLYGDIVIDKTESTSFKLTCNIYRPIIGNSVHVLLNNYTVGTLRLYNNTCYSKAKECSTNSCSCTISGTVFRMYYTYENFYFLTNCTFGVNMFVKEDHGGQSKVTLSKFFNGKGFSKLETKKSTNPIMKQVNISDHKCCKEEDTSWKILWTVVPATLTVAPMLVIMIVVCIHYVYTKDRSNDVPDDIDIKMIDSDDLCERENNSELSNLFNIQRSTTMQKYVSREADNNKSEAESRYKPRKYIKWKGKKQYKQCKNLKRKQKQKVCKEKTTNHRQLYLPKLWCYTLEMGMKLRKMLFFRGPEEKWNVRKKREKIIR